MTPAELIAEYRIRVKYYRTLHAGEPAKTQAYERCLILGQQLTALGIDPAPIIAEVNEEIRRERQNERNQQ